MVQVLFIVARDNDELYTCLTREFGGEEGVEVIFDRRQGERRKPGNQDGLRSHGFVVIHTHE
ncbi:MAG: hypothetical protein ACE5JN_10300 [Candidatus Methylomirabilia bacterium]